MEIRMTIETGKERDDKDQSTAQLIVRQISKGFPGVQALTQVDLTVREGEVHALLGENGAGKSTLSSVIAGLIQPDSGSMEWGGRAVCPLISKRSHGS